MTLLVLCLCYGCGLQYRVYCFLHVVYGAGPPDPPVQVPLPRGRDEEVVLAGVELQPPGGRAKRSETFNNTV